MVNALAYNKMILGLNQVVIYCLSLVYNESLTLGVNLAFTISKKGVYKTPDLPLQFSENLSNFNFFVA